MPEHNAYVAALLCAAIVPWATGCDNDGSGNDDQTEPSGSAAAQEPETKPDEEEEQMMEQQPPASPYADVGEAVALLEPTKGNEADGTVRLEKVDEGVKVTGTVVGLEPGSKHGFHIHQFGDCSAPDGTSAGGHYDPEGTPHALTAKTPRHAGDMGNIVADDDGEAEIDETFDVFTIGEDHPVLGRAIIVHEKEDDGGQPTGNAGARIACGVIGIAQAE